jgi:hypothetical protein
VLHTANVSKGLIERIKNLLLMTRKKNIHGKYENSMVINGKKSASFQMFRLVRQGSVLSPMLLNMTMDEII